MPLLLTALPDADKIYNAIAVLVGAVVLLLLDMLKTTITQYRENRKKIKQSSFVYLAEKQVLLDQATERVCWECKADHASLYRLHNGEYFEGNDSIKKMSMASEAVHGTGLARWKATSQNILMSNFPHMVIGLDKRAIFFMYPESVLDFEAGRMMNERGYQTTVAVMITGKKDRPLAILTLSWCARRVGLEELNTAAIESTRRDLSFTLSD